VIHQSARTQLRTSQASGFADFWMGFAFGVADCVAAAFESGRVIAVALVHAHGPRTDVCRGVGSGSAIRFPSGGPETSVSAKSAARLHRLPLRAEFLDRGTGRWSPQLESFADDHAMPYTGQGRRGLILRDRTGAPFYRASYPERIYADFARFPARVAHCCSSKTARSSMPASQQESAVNWKRFALATAGQRGLDRPAASSRRRKHARHPDREVPALSRRPHPDHQDKLQQMVAASTRSYLDGPDTLDCNSTSFQPISTPPRSVLAPAMGSHRRRRRTLGMYGTT